MSAAGSAVPPTPPEDIDALRARTTRQGNSVRQLKKDGAPQDEIIAAVTELKALKARLAKAEAASAEPKFDSKGLEDLLVQRMFWVPSFEIYGGVKGLYDFGPPGCALKNNVIDIWKRHFVLHEGMQEIECSTLTPHAVLKTSGHVDRFTDLMVKDLKTGECYRADKLLEDHIENLIKQDGGRADRAELERTHRQADAFSPEELGQILATMGIKAPATGNDLSAPFPFNLMFRTTIGPEGTHEAFQRPETAQGIFVNFRRLLDCNNGRMPFAAAQVGLAYRNEISPRAGLLRVREFTMAEIEHFVHPDRKEHPRFARVAADVMTLFPQGKQMGDGKTLEVAIGDAVRDGVVNNETLGYFMARTQAFMVKIGIDRKRLRFRQHLPTEMAHYASDCWDAEIKTAYGWVEMVGHADRACYDLGVHAKKCKVEMVASRRLDAPMVVEAAKLVKGKGKAGWGAIGKTFKRDAKECIAALMGLEKDPPAAFALEAQLAADGTVAFGPLASGKSFEITRAMLSFTKSTKTVVEEKFTPSVIEPSFGIGRILYAVAEHSYHVREDDDSGKRRMLRFNAAVAPVKCSVLSVINKKAYNAMIHEILDSLTSNGLSAKADLSGTSVGKKYARFDEIGVPFGVTVDARTAEDQTVTLRERDSTAQVRVEAAAVPAIVGSLVRGDRTWAQVQAEYPAQE